LVYCAADGCERSGLDGVLPPVSAHERPRPARPKELAPVAPKGKPKPAGLGDGMGQRGEAKDVAVPDRKKPKKRKADVPVRNSFDLKAL